MVPLESIPPPGTNNFWYIRPDAKSVVVFVHGIHSDSRDCWLLEEPDTNNTSTSILQAVHRFYWPRLIADEVDFKDFGVYLGGYFTQKKSEDHGLADCAADLYRELTNSQDHARYPLLKSAQTILFICHSTGGLVVRYMLTSETAAFREKNIALILMASPTLGSYYADVLTLAIEFFNSDLARTLQTKSELAEDLDRRFGPYANVTRRKYYIPNLVGKEACENFMVGRDHKWFQRATKLLGGHKVVDRKSAERYWIPCEQLADTDHFSIVKPKERSSPPHSFVRAAWGEFKEAFGADPGARDVHVPPPARPSEPWIGDPKFLESVWSRLTSADVALYKERRAGKTLCALHLIWSNAAIDEFPDGILWGTIKDDWKFDSVLVEWGVAAGLTRDTVLALKRRSDRVGAVSNAIRNARVLMVLDNCESAVDAELFATIGSKAAHLITTRLRLVAESFSPDHVIEIPDLTSDSIRSLLAAAKSDFVRSNPEPVEFLLRSFGSSPETLLNAIKIANTLRDDQAEAFFQYGQAVAR